MAKCAVLRPHILVLLGIVVLLLLVSARNSYDAASANTSFLSPNINQHQATLSINNRRKIFQEIWQTINDSYVDPTFRGVDWKAVYGDYWPRLESVKDDNEFYGLIDKMIAKLHDSHTRFISPPYPGKIRYGYNVGMSVRKIEGELVVVKVDSNSEAAALGVKPGMTVRSVDGRSARDRLAGIESIIKERYGFSTEHFFKYILYGVYFLGEENSYLVVKLTDFNGKEADVKVKCQEAVDDGALTASCCDSGIGYIKFNKWREPNDKRFRSEIEKMVDVPALIIDLRDNAGGSNNVWINITSKFFAYEAPMGKLVTRSGSATSYFTRKVDTVYKGKVAILINEGSGSASETFAKLMQDNKRATIIGSQSGGAGYYQNTEKISNGGILFYGSKEYISPNGHKIEGVGVTPDIVVPITLSDINQQRDAVLETAKAHLRSR